ncbi:hypothetical protein [Spirosoma flavum]|uniref:Uncharacterized protein n=1 Tax=Spirosoma flavum TaxID=2048557 RepID=A0ABW6AM61_9BACT
MSDWARDGTVRRWAARRDMTVSIIGKMCNGLYVLPLVWIFAIDPLEPFLIQSFLGPLPNHLTCLLSRNREELYTATHPRLNRHLPAASEW